LDDASEKHGEFVATHKRLGATLAVEAKSRRRKGVLHEPGKLDPEAVLRGDISGLFEEAKTQYSGDLPFVIFVDLNSPPQAGVAPLASSWWTGLEAALATHDAVTEGQEETFNALVVTNFATHYFRDAEITTTGERLLINAKRPRRSLATEVLVEMWRSVERYGQFPSDPKE
jgi:hypothetical protein